MAHSVTESQRPKSFGKRAQCFPRVRSLESPKDDSGMVKKVKKVRFIGEIIVYMCVYDNFGRSGAA
ncbi:hypothetical protein BO443_250019 [Burkholderia orbicola]